MKDIKAVIFDYGRVLHHREGGDRWDESASEVLDYCHRKYRLALVSLVIGEKPVERIEKIKRAGFEKYFECIDAVKEDKDAAFERTVKKLGLPYEAIAIVDDRTIRGIAWGNRRGCVTIWLQKSKFSNELPNAETGQPTHTISDLRELKEIL